MHLNTLHRGKDFLLCEQPDIRGKLFRCIKVCELISYSFEMAKYNNVMYVSGLSLEKDLMPESIAMATGRILRFKLGASPGRSTEIEILFDGQVAWVLRSYMRSAKSWTPSKTVLEPTAVWRWGKPQMFGKR